MPRSLKKIKEKAVEESIKMLLEGLGLDLKNPDILDTPKRVARLYMHELNPGEKDEKKLFTTFPSDYASAITIVNHRAFTRCPHHLERVEMDISISYIPNGRLIGLSKLPRIADYFSRGLMLQEEIAEGIAVGLQNALNPKGVAVYIRGNHMCMRGRGVKSYNSSAITSRLTGLFLEDVKAREEFLHIIAMNGGK